MGNLPYLNLRVGVLNFWKFIKGRWLKISTQKGGIKKKVEEE